MKWVDDLKNTIDSLIIGDQSQNTPSVDPEGLLDNLVTAITNDNSDLISTLFNTLQQFFSLQNIGKLILFKALISQDEDTIAKCVLFLLDYPIFTNKEIIETSFDVVPDEIYRIELMQVLANRMWNLDNLLAAINATGDPSIYIRYLLQINYPENAPNNDIFLQNLLKYSSKFPNLFELIIDTLHTYPNFVVTSLILLSLELESSYSKRVLQLLLPYLSIKGWFDLSQAVKYIFDNAPILLPELIRFLFELNLQNWPTIINLLDIPLSFYRSEREILKRFFFTIFETVLNYARLVNELNDFMKQVSIWLTSQVDDWIFVGNQQIENNLKGKGVMDVPIHVWLVGSSLKNLLNNGLEVPSYSISIIMPLVSELNNLGNNMGQQILGWLYRMPGIFILFLPSLLLLAVTIPMKFTQWLGQDIRNIHQDDRQLEIIELPSPSDDPNPTKNTKYMIFSDSHRDASIDVVDPILFDVSHFSKNKEIYKRALIYCFENGYTVIENGDCEELWYHPHLTDDIHDRISDILQLHKDVYDILLNLYKKNRYFRTRGNHDNWWMLTPNRTGPLQEIFGEGFKIFDAIIIPNVKTMFEDWSEILKKLKSGGSSNVLDWMIERLPLGLSPDRYNERKPMFILHGHQVDFWNCDEHQFLGLAITNGIAVPADGIDALPYYFKGVDLYGNPVIEFADYTTSHTPWNNWLPWNKALQSARRIEMMKESDRRIEDSLFFSETIASMLTILLKFQSDKVSLDYISPDQIQILMGHTHNPQSRPYLNLKILDIIPSNVRKTFDLVKVGYFNSGTGGWWEHVIWAIEITEKGQPKLVYWDEHSLSPQVMNWELHQDENPINDLGLVKLLESFLNSIDAKHSNIDSLLSIRSFHQIKNPTGHKIFDLRRTSPEEQYASVAWGFLLCLQKILTNSESNSKVKNSGSINLPDVSFQFKLNLKKIPMFEKKITGIPRSFDFPSITIERLFKVWMEYIGFSDNRRGKWHMCEKNTLSNLSAIFFLAAYLFDSGLLHNLGFILYIFSTNNHPVKVRYDSRISTMDIEFSVN